MIEGGGGGERERESEREIVGARALSLSLALSREREGVKSRACEQSNVWGCVLRGKIEGSDSNFGRQVGGEYLFRRLGRWCLPPLLRHRTALRRSFLRIVGVDVVQASSLIVYQSGFIVYHSGFRKGGGVLRR